jgi:hypothetical protein
MQADQSTDTVAELGTPVRVHIAHPWYADGADTVADLTKTTLDGQRVAWVHERADNPGVSITNAAEKVYDFVQELVGPCVVVECYDDSSYGAFRLGGSTFDLVTIDADGDACWRYLGDSPAAALEAIIAIGIRRGA